MVLLICCLFDYKILLNLRTFTEIAKMVGWRYTYKLKNVLDFISYVHTILLFCIFVTYTPYVIQHTSKLTTILLVSVKSVSREGRRRRVNIFETKKKINSSKRSRYDRI